MKIYGHPWSISTRKVLMTLAEKGATAELVTVVIPKGEQKLPEHLARHPFAKVPVLEDGAFMLYETRAINRYLNDKLPGASLVPSDPQHAARVEQWTNVLDAYFEPFARPLIVESLFRRYLGGPTDKAAIAQGREGIQPALTALDDRLGDHPFVAGSAFTLADIHWMPYVEYLVQIGEADAVQRRSHLAAWWERVSARPTWRAVARTGPQPYDS